MKRTLFTIGTLTLAVLSGICFAFLPQSYIQVGVGVAAASFYQTVQSAGVSLTQRPTLNFVSGVTCVDNAGLTRTDCTGSGGTFTATPPYISDGILFYGPAYQFIKPIDANYSWVNQGTATETTQNGSITLIDGTNEANFNVHARVKAVPATPYHVIAAYTFYQGANANQLLGLGWRDSATGKMIIYGNFQLTVNQIVAFTCTNPTTFGGGTPINQTGFQFSGMFWLRIGDDGVNRTYDIGTDGQTWLNLLTEPTGTFLTADQVMFFINGGKASMKLYSWQETG